MTPTTVVVVMDRMKTRVDVAVVMRGPQVAEAEETCVIDLSESNHSRPLHRHVSSLLTCLELFWTYTPSREYESVFARFSLC